MVAIILDRAVRIGGKVKVFLLIPPAISILGVGIKTVFMAKAHTCSPAGKYTMEF